MSGKISRRLRAVALEMAGGDKGPLSAAYYRELKKAYGKGTIRLKGETNA